MNMDADTFEKIAEQVHQGWMRQKISAGFADHTIGSSGVQGFGFRLIQCCDLPSDRHHPDMLPYDQLADHIQEYDRATVRAVLAGIDAAGLVVVPATTAPHAEAPTR